MKKLLVVVLALFAWSVESRESKESKNRCCSVKVKKITSACFGQDTGKITFRVKGNTEPYKAVLKSATPGSSFKPRKITDIPNEATLSFDNLPPDTYNLFLKSTCCSKCLTDILVPEETQIIVTHNTTSTCFGEENGTLSFTVTGGTPPYRAKLINSDSQLVQKISDIQSGVPTTVKNLPADTYSLVIKDEQGCTETVTDIVVTQSTQIIPQVTSIISAHLDFATGAITFTVTGGTPMYTAELFNSTSTAPVQTLTGIAQGVPTTFMNLTADTYRIVIIDFNGCMVTDPGIVVPSSPVLAQLVTPVISSCFGENNGAISFTVTGGTPGTQGYTAELFISTSSIPVQTKSGIIQEATFTDLVPGTYTILVVDSLGNQGSIQNIAVIELSPLIIRVLQVTPASPGAAIGTITVSVTGGEPPYAVQLFTNTTPTTVVQTIPIALSGAQGVFTGVPIGNYHIIVTDKNGCQVTDPEVTVPNSIADFIRGKYC